MPTLIIEQPGSRTGGRVTGLVLIGRLPTNGIALNDSSVSRLHAWIDRDRDGRYFVADIGSLTGTRVNGRPIERRQTLHDGDAVRVGQSQVIFSDEDDLPDGVTPIDLLGLPPSEDVADNGVLFSCPCGAPAWFKAASIGLPHKCRHCGRTIRVPALPGVVAEVIEEPPAVAEPGVPVSKARAAPPEYPADEHGLSDSVGHGLSDSAAHGLSDSIGHGLGDSLAHGLAEAHEPDADESAAEDPAFQDVLIEEVGEGHELPSDPQPLPSEATAPSQTDETHGTAESAVSTEPMPVVIEEPLGVPSEAHHAVDELEPTAVGRPSLFQTRQPEVADEPTPPPAAAADVCSVCHGEIDAGESTTTCPSCGLTFHAECWRENKGCSAYGCPQVGALRTEDEVAADAQKTAPEYADAGADAAANVSAEPPPIGYDAAALAAEAPAAFPWEFLFLATSVVGVLLGTLAYGVPAVVGALGTALYLLALRDPRTRRGVLVVALLVCLIGAALGAWFSHRWYHGWPPVDRLLYRSTWRHLF